MSPLPCPDRANVLLVGGGGREHALAWKLRQSPRLGRLWIAGGGNAALAELGDACPVELDARRPFHAQRWCEREAIDLVVIGPEAPLAAGLADALAAERRMVFGPGRAGARLEADKAWAKKLMRQAAVPTADARVFERLEVAREYFEAHEEPCVVKASGLAAGKGVVVCDDGAAAIAAVEEMMGARTFGDAGATVVVEERLDGAEVSILALVDGRTIWLLDPAQDHKQRDEGDRGPNTGGMGAYAPTPAIDRETLRVVEREVFVPIVDAMKREGIEYRGVLYAGLMLTLAGPKVLEFNCRFGDPECQPLMRRLEGDLVEICWATAAGTLDEVEIAFDERTSCCVVMCSEGYPGRVRSGLPIEGIDEAEALGDVVVFHAGTKRDESGRVVTAGGRVLGVTAVADDLLSARNLANRACERIRFDGAFWRRDIGDRVLQRA